MLSTLLERVRDSKEDQHGFTLIELLVVITILGILAAIVVFSVGGIGDKGQLSACKTDTVTIRTAEEANLAGTPTTAFPFLGNYTDQGKLVQDGLLSQASILHYVALTGTAGANVSFTTTANQGYQIWTVTGTPGNNSSCGTTNAAQLVAPPTVN